MARVLVTGASGLLGARLVKRLSLIGHEVTAVVRPGRSVSHAGVRVLQRDLGHWAGDGLGPLDAIVYLAQSLRYRDFPDGATDVLDVNVRTPLALAQQARKLGARQFVYASTGTVYAPSFEAITETSPVDPRSFYERTKDCAERLLRGFEADLEIKIVRPFFLFGPGQRPTMTVPSVVGRVLRGEPVLLQPRAGVASDDNGLRFRWIDADDAALCVARLLEHAGSCTLNLVGDDEASIRGVAEMAGRVAGRSPLFSPAPQPRLGDFLASNAQLRARVGSVRFKTLEEAVVPLVDSIRGQEPNDRATGS